MAVKLRNFLRTRASSFEGVRSGMLIFATAIGGALVLAGCTETVVGSYRPGVKPNDEFKTEQIAGFYMLPRGLLRVQLKEKDGRFTINVAEPVYSGDPETGYTLYYSASELASDTVEIEIDPATSLLKGVQLRAEDKLDEIIVEVARAIAIILESAEAAPKEIILIDRMIDPSDEVEIDKLRKDMNSAAKALADKRHAAECGANLKKQKPEEEAARLQACTGYQQMMSGTAIDFVVTPPTFDGSALANVIGKDACQRGICIRPTLPYTVSFSFTGGEAPAYFSTTVALPNKAPAIPLQMLRSSFVTRVTNVTLSNGMLQKFHLEKPSEGLDVVSIPLQIVKAIFGTMAELIQLKIDLSGKEEALAKQEVARIQAERDLEEKRAAMPESAGKPEDLALILQGSNGVPAPAESPLPRIIGTTPPTTGGGDQGSSLVPGTEDPNQ